MAHLLACLDKVGDPSSGRVRHAGRATLRVQSRYRQEKGFPFEEQEWSAGKLDSESISYSVRVYGSLAYNSLSWSYIQDTNTLPGCQNGGESETVIENTRDNAKTADR